MQYLSTKDNNFICNGNNVMLRGVGLGNWLCLEHFMLGLPGTETQIRQAILETYGQEKYDLFWNTYYRAYISEKDIAYIAQCGMNHIRIPISYKLFYTDSFENSVAIREIDRILEYCKKHSIWAILDIHAVPGGQNPNWHSDNSSGQDNFWYNSTAMSQIVELWKDIATYYKDEPTVGAYDLINEPCFFKNEAEKNMIAFFESCTQAIRSVDTKHIILYSGNTYSRDFSVFTSNLDDNSAYTFHLYPFLQIQESIRKNNVEDAMIKSLYTDVTLEHLENTLKKPLWCGETGHPMHMSESYDILPKFLHILEDKNIGWALWPLKDRGAMGILHQKENSSWNTICNKLSDNWIFWNIFSEDSILAAEKEDDKYAYYHRLAENSTKAWETVRTNLKNLKFETLLDSLNDFSFDNCIQNKELIKY